MKSVLNSTNFIKIGSEMSSGDLCFLEMFLYEYRVKFSCAPTLLATLYIISLRMGDIDIEPSN
jgi:hypothetical protein